VPALLVRDHDDRTPLKPGRAAHDGRIVAEFTIPMNFAKIGKYPADEILHIRPPIVPGQLHTLYRRLPVILFALYQFHSYSPPTKSTSELSPLASSSAVTAGETFTLKHGWRLRPTVIPSSVST